MITALSHATIYVDNQEAARRFYTEKLGFEVRMDVENNGFRWLTVGPKGQANLEIVLMEPTVGPMFDAETVTTIKSLLKKGALGAGVLATEDCQATYEALKERGVEFIAPPQERPYGTEAIMKDNSGNWFSVTQRRK